MPYFIRILHLAAAAAIVAPSISRSEIRLRPSDWNDRVPLVAVLADTWRDGCVPSLASFDRDPPALAASTTGRLTVRLDATPVGVCAEVLTDYELEIPLGVLPSGRYALDVLVDDPVAGGERYLDGTTFDVFAGGSRERLHLADGRFVASAERGSGGGLVPARVADQQAADSGLFWFFEPDNWEISVKLLDGCHLNDHFWVLGAATTDVPWRLEIADRLTGERFGVEHAGGDPSPALIDVQSFPCDDTEACGSGEISDILASPRPDQDAERLAILLDGGVAARADTYSRLARDLAEIHRLRPETLGIGVSTSFGFSALTLHLAPEAADELEREGELADTRCLDARYGKSFEQPTAGGDALLVEFDAVLDMRRVAAEYASLPSVEVALVRTFPLPQGPPQVCVTRDGDLWSYFLRDLSPVEPAPWFHFTSTPEEGVTEVDIYRRGDPEPPWLMDGRRCLEDLGVE